MSRRSGLGKGLGALIPTEVAEDHQQVEGLLDIPVSAVVPNRQQPRSSFDEASLASLTESIRELGVLQPIIVRAADAEGTFELIAGERRWRAARRAGLSTIPCIVRAASDLDSLEQAIVENLHRQDLNPLEEASAYHQLIDEFGLTQEQAAKRVGKSRSAVANILRLLQLPPSVQKALSDGELSAGHARALLSSPDRAYQEALTKKIIAEDLSVRAVETLVREREEIGTQLDQEPTRAQIAQRPTLRPPGLLELEELLSGHLDTRVAVNMSAKKGKVVIEFANLDDLERIYRIITDS